MIQVEQGEYINGAIRVLSGKYQDAILKLQPEEELVIGRDVKECHLIFEAPWVSRKHCKVSYDYEQQVYVVVDYSENGIFTKEGERLMQGVSHHFRSGTILIIGENGVSLQLM